MTSCLTEEDVSLKNSDSISTTNSCPFNNLHPRIELEILKKLKYRDYRNLAFTCKKWYQTAVSAPVSVKPDITNKEFAMNYSIIDKYGLLKYRINYDDITFQLLNKVKCSYLFIDNMVLSEASRFIQLNRCHLEFESISISREAFMSESTNKNNYLLVEPLLDMAPKIEWCCDPRSRIHACLNEKFLMRFLENHLSHRDIAIAFAVSLECLNLILKQWVKGERPNLEYVEYDSDSPSDWEDLTEGVQKFVQKRTQDYESFDAEIVVPGLPVLKVSGGFAVHLSIVFRRKVTYASPIE